MDFFLSLLIIMANGVIAIDEKKTGRNEKEREKTERDFVGRKNEL